LKETFYTIYEKSSIDGKNIELREIYPDHKSGSSKIAKKTQIELFKF